MTSLGGPPFHWASNSDNYVALGLDPEQGVATVVHVGASGETLATHVVPA